MKVSKAIEILLLSFVHIKDASDLDRDTAIKLGIEALKRCQYIAEHTDRWAGVLLPGETPEDDTT